MTQPSSSIVSELDIHLNQIPKPKVESEGLMELWGDVQNMFEEGRKMVKEVARDASASRSLSPRRSRARTQQRASSSDAALSNPLRRFMFTSPSTPSISGSSVSESVSSGESEVISQPESSIMDAMWGFGQKLVENPTQTLAETFTTPSNLAGKSPKKRNRRKRSSPSQKAQRATSVPSSRRGASPLPTIMEGDETDDDSYLSEGGRSHLTSTRRGSGQRARSSGSILTLGDSFANRLTQLQSELRNLFSFFCSKP